MELIKLCLVLCGMRWADGAAVADAADGGFSAAAAQLLREISMPAERAALAPVVLRDLETVLQPHFPGCKAELFGSIATGLAIVKSDVDVCITYRNQTLATLSELVVLASGFMRQHPDLFRVIKTVPQARKPILTVNHLATGFNVDINFNSYNGVMNSKLVRYLMSLEDRAKDFAQILKHWARLHQITGQRMLPSYGIITMAIFFLQLKEILPTVVSLQKNAQSFIVDDWNMGFTEDRYGTTNNETLCELLGGFFEYYNYFEFKKYMVSPYVGRPVEINLFKDLDRVPDEFELYKTNVRLNITKPVRLKIPVVQDSFEHNMNMAYRIDIPPRSVFLTSIRYAMKKYYEGCAGFLGAILAV